MNPIEEAKKEYLATDPPDRLNAVVSGAMARGMRKRRLRFCRRYLSAAAAFFIVFVAMLNSSSVFAGAVEGVPVLNEFARAVTFREYAVGQAVPAPSGAAPSPAGGGRSGRAADGAGEAVPFLLAADDVPAEEFLAGQVRFETMSLCDGILSFAVYPNSEDSTGEPFFYTVREDSGTELTLADLLGPDYQSICNRQVSAELSQRCADSLEPAPRQETAEEFTGITEEQRFYRDGNGNVVLRFAPSELPGCETAQEFTINSDQETLESASEN